MIAGGRTVHSHGPHVILTENLQSSCNEFFPTNLTLLLAGGLKTDLATDLPIAFKFKFVSYGHIKKKELAPYVQGGF